jgi:glyoxylase-like metal-dependent hydrolase (beta-lactamase superfamily II)
MPFNDEVEQARNALVKLEKLKADIVLPGHGDPWTSGVAEAVRAARIA